MRQLEWFQGQNTTGNLCWLGWRLRRESAPKLLFTQPPRARAPRRESRTLTSLPTHAPRTPHAPRPTSNSCPEEENLEKYLSEVEMKLQLLAEDISLALEEESLAGPQLIGWLRGGS